MRVDWDEGDKKALQQLVTKRFAMAAGTYALALLLTWITVIGGFYQAPVETAVLCAGLILVSQLVFFWIFIRGHNLRFRDPSLTEPQVLVGLVCLTYFLFNVGSNRGSLLVLYLLVLMFAVFLQPRVFVRYAALALFSFIGLSLLDLQLDRLDEPQAVVLQACVLLVTLIWMCFFVGYVNRLRQRMRQRSSMSDESGSATIRGSSASCASRRVTSRPKLARLASLPMNSSKPFVPRAGSTALWYFTSMGIRCMPTVSTKSTSGSRLRSGTCAMSRPMMVESTAPTVLSAR